MIPKKIFSIWLSDKPELPAVVELCLQTHKIYGYEHRIITLENCYRNKYINDAIAAKQWGKAADYLRCWYLIQEGGIHLDADMYVLLNKNFDRLLDNKFFASRENNGFVNTAAMGAEQGSQLLVDHLKEVEEKFRGDDGLFFESSIELITYRIYEAAKRGEATILPPEIFYPYDHQRNTVIFRHDTVAMHFFMKTWK